MAQVDPDAIGSAFGMKALLGGDVFYAGKFGHPQNRCIANKYNLMSEMQPVSEMPKGAKVILVDSHDAHDGRLDIESIYMIVDHHRGEPDIEVEGEIIIEDVGAASTLVVERLEEMDKRTATLLALGIYTDTGSLLGATERDREAYAKCMEFTSTHEVMSLVNYPLPPSHFKNLTFALNNMKKDGEGRCLASVGFLPPEQGDDISSIADYLIRMDSISLVVVWGIVNSEVRVAARNVDLSTPLDEYLSGAFGESSGAKLTPDGRGVGGARIPIELGFWGGDDTKDEVMRLIEKKLEVLVL